MGKTSSHLSSHHQSFINLQKMFFVATAPKEGFINLSPKGMSGFKIMDKKTVIWLNLTGSGNETAAHLLEDERMTIMFNAFEGNPMILRIYGKANAIHKRHPRWDAYIENFSYTKGARQIIEVDIEMVQTSCGFGVPIMEYKQERKELTVWANKKGEEGLNNYHREKNIQSLNGKQTGILED